MHPTNAGLCCFIGDGYGQFQELGSFRKSSESNSYQLLKWSQWENWRIPRMTCSFCSESSSETDEVSPNSNVTRRHPCCPSDAPWDNVWSHQSCDFSALILFRSVSRTFDFEKVLRPSLIPMEEVVPVGKVSDSRDGLFIHSWIVIGYGCCILQEVGSSSKTTADASRVILEKIMHPTAVVVYPLWIEVASRCKFRSVKIRERDPHLIPEAGGKDAQFHRSRVDSDQTHHQRGIQWLWRAWKFKKVTQPRLIPPASKVTVGGNLWIPPIMYFFLRRF